MRPTFVLGSLAALLSTPPLVAAFQDGPLPGLTGGFGEQTCLACHFDNQPNDPGGSLRLEGIPKSYIAGREYDITIILKRSGLKRGGFELSARIAEGASAGQQAGGLRPSDARTRTIYGTDRPVQNIQYIQHTKAGSEARNLGESRWIVRWTAPHPAAGAVTFNAAANASDADASPLGDYIYFTERVSSRPGQF
jgi:hypothetical protein